MVKFRSLITLLCWCVLSTLVLLGGQARAHDISPAIVDLTINPNRVDIRIVGSIEPMVLGYNLGEIVEIGEGPEDGPYRDLRATPVEEYKIEVERAWEGMQSDMTLLIDGRPYDLIIDKIEVIDRENLELPRDTAIFAYAEYEGDAPKVRFGWAQRLGYMVLRQQGTTDDDNAFAGIIPLGDLSPELTADFSNDPAWQTFLNYIYVGFEHIVPKGLDHILFVLGLFFFALKWHPLLWQVTTFTLAHTITLALASLNLVSLPASIVEPLIALSIAYVAIENIFGDGETTPRRLMVIFFFGLLHGLGFASVLSDVGLQPSQFIAGLIGFNIGVEFGQITVLVAAFFLVGMWFGERPWYKKYIANPASLAIAAIGLFWTIERVSAYFL